MNNSCLNCEAQVAYEGQMCSAECYSEWLLMRIDPAGLLHLNEQMPLPLAEQPWYQGFIYGG